jgi:class 3 adenylate cyclase
VSALPTGIVTFLFTDIEGSTRLWERYPDDMPTALDRHDSILRDSIVRHDGVIFRTVGDAVFAAFAGAVAALLAAIDAQNALYIEPWGTVGAIRVRMALHTSAAELRDNAYFGPPLNRVARLLAAGHGGQTLVCRVTQEHVREQLPGGVVLRDMGEHLLKDLSQPEQIFQLDIAHLPSEFSPLKTVTNQLADTAALTPGELPPVTEGYISRQHKLPGMPEIDFDAVLKKERERRPKKGKGKQRGELF